jgi:hypothetical protein
MSKRLDQERQKQLEPKRVEYAEEKLAELGISCVRLTDGELQFEWEGSVIKLFAYSGWWQGNGITPGRGIDNLIKRLKEKKRSNSKDENKLQRCSCGGNMIKRKNRQTQEPFYGCSNWPRCTKTKKI